jgi:hypothetical protein
MNQAPFSSSTITRQTLNALANRFKKLYNHIYILTFSVEICRHQSYLAKEPDFELAKQNRTLIAREFHILYLEAQILLSELQLQQSESPDAQEIKTQLSLLTSLIWGMKIFVQPELINQYKTKRADPLFINGGAKFDLKKMNQDGVLNDTVVGSIGLLVGVEQQFQLSYVLRQNKEKEYAQELKNRVMMVLSERRELHSKRKILKRMLGHHVIELYLQGWILCLINGIEHSFGDEFQTMSDIAKGLSNSDIYVFLLEYLRHVTIEEIEDLECYNYPSEKLESIILQGVKAMCLLARNAHSDSMVGIPVLQSFFEYFCSVIEQGAFSPSQSMREKITMAKEAIFALYDYALLRARVISAEGMPPEKKPEVIVPPPTPREELIQKGFSPAILHDGYDFIVPVSHHVQVLMDLIDQAGYLRLIQGGFVTDELFRSEYPTAEIESRDIDWLIVGIDIPKLVTILQDYNKLSDLPRIEGIRINVKSASLVVTLPSMLEKGRSEEVEIATTMNLQQLAEGFGINCAFYYDPNRKIVLDPLHQLPDWLKNPILRATIPVPTTLVMLTALYKYTRYQHSKIPINIDPQLRGQIIEMNAKFGTEVVDIKWTDKLLLQGFVVRAFTLLIELNCFSGLFRMSSTTQKTLDKICSGIEAYLNGKTFMALTSDELQRCRAFVFANLLFESFSKTSPPMDGDQEDYRKHVTGFLAKQPFCTHDFFDPLCELLLCMTRASLLAPYEEANYWLMGTKKSVKVPDHPYEFKPQSTVDFSLMRPKKRLPIPTEQDDFQPENHIQNELGPSSLPRGGF